MPLPAAASTNSPPDPSLPAPFRHRKVAGKYLLTNLAGQYVFLEEQEFSDFVAGRLDPNSSAARELCDKNFLRASANVADLADQLDLRKSFLDYGPNLHVIEVTLRCNQTCLYCHSSRAPMTATDRDMSLETAERVVDLIFQSTSPSLTIEFQGGEPLANFPTLQRVVDYALEKNQRACKSLEFTLVSNLSLMDEDKLSWLLDHKVQICTSIDGPADLHDGQRKLAGGEAFEQATRWIARINQAYVEAGLDPDVYHTEGLLTTTRHSLGRAREIVDAYRSLGFRALFLRPVDPFGFASKTGPSLCASAEEYLGLYAEVLDYMIELGLAGEQILERYASILLTKILAGEDPNFLDLRSPCGAGIGQLAYTHDGQIFTCDEARMLNHMGDDFFRLGKVGETGYRQALQHDTVQAMALASNLDASADCSSCVYAPYCGICPVYNYVTQGSLRGQMRTSSWCATLMGIQDLLFTRLLEGGDEVRRLFERWITIRPRSYYLHLGDSFR